MTEEDDDDSSLSDDNSLRFRLILNNGSSRLEASNIEDLTRWEEAAVFAGSDKFTFRGVKYEKYIDSSDPGEDEIYRRTLEYIPIES